MIMTDMILDIRGSRYVLVTNIVARAGVTPADGRGVRATLCANTWGILVILVMLQVWLEKKLKTVICVFWMYI